MKTKQFLPGGVALSYLQMAFLMLCLSLLSTRLSAQIVIPAVNADNLLGTQGYPNSASIDYTPNCTGGPCVGIANHQLTALVEDHGASPRLYIYDQVNLAGVNMPIPTGSMPDVTIGNDVSTPNRYIVGVVATIHADVYLALYRATLVGSGSLTLSAVPYATYNISNTGQAIGPAHIDIEARYSTPFLGLPESNNFAITWQDVTQGIMGYYASLGNPTSGTPTVINSSTALSSPDVALVERINPSTNAFENWALFGYADMTANIPTAHYLYYQEWNTATVPASATTYDHTYDYVRYPAASALRIDAIDDFHFNNPGPGVYGMGTPPANNAFFDIVISHYNPMTDYENILEYNNIRGTFNPYDITSPIAALYPYENFFPVVACGPGNFYSAGYFSSALTSAYYSTAIDWATGTPTTDPNAHTLNNTAWTRVGSDFGVTLSATCNTDGPQQQLFASWENGGSLYYKYDQNVPYVFKPAAMPNVANGNWQLSPNPATDMITLTAPTGSITKDNASYQITDLSGKVLLRGNIHEIAERIDVNNLAAGMYLLSVYSNATDTRMIKFVKE